MRLPTTFERLVNQHRANRNNQYIIVATIGRVSESDDLYYRLLYAAIRCGYIRASFG